MESSAQLCWKIDGEVLVEPRNMGGGLFCVIRDPEGAICILYLSPDNAVRVSMDLSDGQVIAMDNICTYYLIHMTEHRTILIFGFYYVVFCKQQLDALNFKLIHPERCPGCIVFII